MLIHLNLLMLLFFLCVVVEWIASAPVNDKYLYDDGRFTSRYDQYDEESRTGHRRRRPGQRPCVGKSSPEGRTFFDWNFQYLDASQSQHYNIDCGDVGGGHRPGLGAAGSRPILGDGGHKPGGHFGNRPQGGLFGGNRPLADAFMQIQSQAQAVVSNGDIFDVVASIFPQPGIFDALGSLFPQNLGENIGNFVQNLFNRPSSPQSPPSELATSTPGTPAAPVDPVDPDDIIYNDEKPVTEDNEAVVADGPSRPGQYFVASNPVLGDFVQDLNFDINPNKAIRQLNRRFNKWVVRPLTHLLRR